MHVKTIDLGRCSFDKPKTQIHAIAQATASYSPDPSCSASDLSLSSLNLDSLCWFSICSKLHIRLSVTLNHNLGLAVGKKSLTEQTLSQSLERAQLWSQLGLRAYLATTEWSYTSYTSNITLDLSVSSNYTTFDSSTCAHDSSEVQPPAGVPIHRLNAVHILVNISKNSSRVIGGNTIESVNTLLQASPENSGHAQTYQTGSNDISVSHISRCSELIRVGDMKQKNAETSKEDRKAIFSLVDICFRRVICLNSRIPRGTNLTQDAQLMGLADLVPSSFISDHGQQLSRRTYLIQPIARFLAAYSSRVSTRNRFRDLSVIYDDGTRSKDEEIDDEALLTKESCAASLWILISKALAAKASNSSLKPLVFDTNHEESRIDLADPQHDILDKKRVNDDCQSVCSLDSDSRDISLFEVYSAQISGGAGTIDRDRFERSLHTSDGGSDRSKEGVISANKSPDQIEPNYGHKQASACHTLSDEDAGYLERWDCDYEMLSGTTFLSHECSRAVSERKYKVTERESPSEAVAELATTPSTSLFSMIMVDGDGDETNGTSHTDDDFQEMLDMQEGLLYNDHDGMSDLLLESSCAEMRAARPWCGLATGFVTENLLSDADILQVKVGHHSTLLMESGSVDGHDGSTMVSNIAQDGKHTFCQVSNMAMVDDELDTDQDMIPEYEQQHEESDGGDDSLIDFEYERQCAW